MTPPTQEEMNLGTILALEKIIQRLKTDADAVSFKFDNGLEDITEDWDGVKKYQPSGKHTITLVYQVRK